MMTARGAGRVVGTMMLAQVVAGMVINLVLLGPLFSVPPGFMENAAAGATQVRLGVLVGLGASVLSVAIAITLARTFWSHSPTMAAWLLALAVAGFTLSAVENQTVMSLLSLSQAYVAAGTPDGELYAALRSMAAATRNWAHYVGLMVSGGMLLVFYALLYRFARVPRVLTAFGLAAVVSMLAVVTAPLLGQRIVFLALMPLALTQILTALWLIAKGLAPRQESAQRDRAHPALSPRP
jgi:MFS family permease